jgi:hypothetical protein
MQIRQYSVDKTVDKKTKGIECMESHIKNYFDQINTKNELKDLADSNNLSFDKINNTIISKESLNNSNISNIFEKNSQIKSTRRKDKDRDKDRNRDNQDSKYQVNQYYDSYGLLEQTPQFQEEKGVIYGCLVDDFYKTRVTYDCNYLGWRIIW